MEAAEADVLAYDVDEANRLLDDMGLTERDSAGFRLMADGRRLTINFTMDTIVENQWRSSDQTQIIAQQWKEIGVELNFNLVERSLLTEMAAVRDTLVNMPLGHFQPDSWVAWKYFPEGWWLE